MSHCYFLPFQLILSLHLHSFLENNASKVKILTGLVNIAYIIYIISFFIIILNFYFFFTDIMISLVMNVRKLLRVTPFYFNKMCFFIKGKIRFFLSLLTFENVNNNYLS